MTSGTVLKLTREDNVSMKRLLNSIFAVACLTASLVNAQESAEAKLSFNPGHYKGWSLAVPPLSWNREAMNLNDNRFSYTVKSGDEECSFLIYFVAV